MQFKTKDLLVTVLPKAEISEADLAKYCLLRTVICRHPSLCNHPSICHHWSINCGGCSLLVTIDCGRCSWNPTLNCGYCSMLPTCHACSVHISAPPCDALTIPPWCRASVDPWVLRDAEGLAELRTELQAALKSLDSIEKEGLPSPIGSKQDAEALERSLTEALEQVRAAKKKL